MNIDLPYTTVEECIEAGIAKRITKVGMVTGDNLTTHCSDLACENLTNTAWIFNSQVFVFENGRLLTRPVTLWFPLCRVHAPLQDEQVIDAVAEPVLPPALPPAKEN